ncbi:MAG TPA: beta-ketoacyl synthase N-terminal-like domain-containing protein [Roseiflexaceae bacterium]|nr:beta-ketoacyl synthase N-terminal-like domain-containing protein [Roseiflexaceae bacterium]
MEDELRARDIAIIGMAGRFPGAPDLDTFWQNLAEARDVLTRFSDEQLAAAGVPAEEYGNPNYVKAGMVLDGVEEFDAGFFGYNPSEAALLDPQQRLFMEHAWEALERAGYTPQRYQGLIGLYAGVAWNTYLLSNLTAHPDLFDASNVFQTFITSDKDFMPTRVSYKLNLRGPSMIVQTSCSTSLVAVHQACTALLVYDCDMALAGGVTAKVPQHSGYLYQEGGLGSPDGRCRSFDAEAQGTIFGSGVGVVVLKRLADALRDGDTVLAVIRGTAINNDGSAKVSYTAPSIEGQAEVIAAAQAAADVDADTISYIEAHGTATALGDPIEVAALTRVFREGTHRSQFCALGSVKSNIGHLDAAAGVAGLLKTVLALQHGQIPPSLHYRAPNPKIDFASSPFFVNTALREWGDADGPRRAGVSSFGVGGTNAHVILEEATRQPASGPSRPWQILTLSARSDAALERATDRLAAHLRANPGLALADVAYTLQQGRATFRHRRALVCSDIAEAAETLEQRNPQRLWDQTDTQDPRNRPVAFLFPGQGAQYAGMARDLYEREAVFRTTVDHCAALLKPLLGLDLRALIFDEPERESTKDTKDANGSGHDNSKLNTQHSNGEASGLRLEAWEHNTPEAENSKLKTQHPKLTETRYAQPALFVVEYALAQLWQSWGVKPSALIGHSIGEYVAATLAGVFRLEDALALVAARGRLMHTMPAGAMLSVQLPEPELLPLLDSELSLAAVNGPRACVAAGPEHAIAALEQRLAARDIPCRRLHTSHAFHSAMMHPAVVPFAAQVRRIERRAPQIPFLSNLTGTWITREEAVDPEYWARHLRQPVRFADGIATLLRTPDYLLLEVGPGTTLSTLARQQDSGVLALPSLRHPTDTRDDQAFALSTLGRLWLAGLPVDWSLLHADEQRRRVPLPTYPFERQRFWIEPSQRAAAPRPASAPASALTRRADPAEWCYLPSWKRTLAPPRPSAETLAQRDGGWLLFEDGGGVAAALAQHLANHGQQVTLVAPGAHYQPSGPGRYLLAPGQPEHYRSLCEDLRLAGRMPHTVVHLWGADRPDEEAGPALERTFYSLLFLAQALGQLSDAPEIGLAVVTSGAQQIAGDAAPAPEQAAALGLCRVIPQEYLHLSCRCIDLDSANRRPPAAVTAGALLADLAAGQPEAVVAYRRRERWAQSFEQVRLEAGQAAPLRPGGVYAITGGLSGIGLALAQHLAAQHNARLALIEPAPFPPQAEWAAWLEEHDQQDQTSRRIRRAQELEQQGVPVLVQAVEGGSAYALRGALDRVAQTLGPIHGLIHAAGADHNGSFLPIQELDRDACEQQFGPSLRGLATLIEALDGRALDFCCVASSLAAFLGGRGYAGPVAASLAMDALTHGQALRGPARWLTINWDASQEEAGQTSTLNQDLARLALQGGEVGLLFERALAADLDQLLVSTADLGERIGQAQARLASLRADLRQPEAERPRHPRPRLQTSYVAPAGPQEQQIAEVWQRVLGFEQIGVHDNFFDLGGDSLIALRLVGQLKAALGVDLPVVRLYQALTVRALAELLEQNQHQSQQRSTQLQERKEELQRRKQYQQMRRSQRDR